MFFVVGFVLARMGNAEGANPNAKAVITGVVLAVLVGTVAIAGFFYLEG